MVTRNLMFCTYEQSLFISIFIKLFLRLLLNWIHCERSHRRIAVLSCNFSDNLTLWTSYMHVWFLTLSVSPQIVYLATNTATPNIYFLFYLSSFLSLLHFFHLYHHLHTFITKLRSTYKKIKTKSKIMIFIIYFLSQYFLFINNKQLKVTNKWILILL